MTIRQIIVSCNSTTEASRIGSALLKQRCVGCYDVVVKASTSYFWPPKKQKIMKGRGAILMAMTLPRHVARAKQLIVKKHSDKIPFVGSVEVHDVSHEYYHWLAGELLNHV